MSNEVIKKEIEKANAWETSRALEIEKRAGGDRRDKYIAFGVAGCMALALFMLVPLKEKVPYLIREDKTSGAVDIVGKLSDATVTANEARDKYWLGRYVTARETYDYFSLQNDFDTVRLLSTQSAVSSYVSKFTGADALDKRYKDSTRVDVKLVSIVLDNPRTATIRFHTINRAGATLKEQSWIATVSFEYDSADKLTDSERLINPFGFQVTSYRVDPEMITQPVIQPTQNQPGMPNATPMPTGSGQ